MVTPSSASWMDDTDLKAYFRFNESSGNIINQSQSSQSLGSNSDLIMTSGTYEQAAPIGSTNALLFDGTDDFGVSGTSLSQYNFIHEGKTTICMWMKLVTAVNYGLIMDNTGWGHSRGGTMLTESSKNLNWQLQNGTNQIVDNAYGGDNYIPDTTTFYFYTFRTDVDVIPDVATMNRDLGDIKQADRQNAPSDGNSIYPMQIGRRDDSFYCNMELSELSIWNRILSDDEISGLYNSGSGRAIYE